MIFRYMNYVARWLNKIQMQYEIHMKSFIQFLSHKIKIKHISYIYEICSKLFIHYLMTKFRVLVTTQNSDIYEISMKKFTQFFDCFLVIEFYHTLFRCIWNVFATFSNYYWTSHNIYFWYILIMSQFLNSFLMVTISLHIIPTSFIHNFNKWLA